MTAWKSTGNTPGIAAHRLLQPLRIEVEVIDRNHLKGETKLLGGPFKPVAEGGFATSREGAQPDQMSLGLIPRSFCKKRQSKAPEPIGRGTGWPEIQRGLKQPAASPLLLPGHGVGHTEVVQQTLLIDDWKIALPVRIQP